MKRAPHTFLFSKSLCPLTASTPSPAGVIAPKLYMLQPHNIHSLITLETIKNNSVKFSVTTGNPKFLDCPLPLDISDLCIP